MGTARRSGAGRYGQPSLSNSTKELQGRYNGHVRLCSNILLGKDHASTWRCPGLGEVQPWREPKLVRESTGKNQPILDVELGIKYLSKGM